MRKTIVLITSAALTLSACATTPEKITAAPVSPLAYNSLSCAQIGREAARVNNELGIASSEQTKAANNDAAMTAVGLILFWPAVFFIKGGDDASVARLKGEANALRQAAVQKGCL